MTEIIKCTCNHPFQDEIYGFHNRAANSMRSGQLKCTVCGTIIGSKSIVPQSDKIAVKIEKSEASKKAKDESKSSDKAAKKVGKGPKAATPKKKDPGKKMGKK